VRDEPYPWQIIFSQRQIRWLLAPGNWDAIRQGHWPFSISDYVVRSKNIRRQAYFEPISLVKIEMESRLESVSKDGEMCLRRYHDEYNDERIAKYYGVPIMRVNGRIKRAMRYIAGRDRKNISYEEWIKNGWR